MESFGEMGCPFKFINLVRQLHEGITAEVLCVGEKSELLCKRHVQQGCEFVCSLPCTHDDRTES